MRSAIDLTGFLVGRESTNQTIEGLSPHFGALGIEEVPALHNDKNPIESTVTIYALLCLTNSADRQFSLLASGDKVGGLVQTNRHPRYLNA